MNRTKNIIIVNKVIEAFKMIEFFVSPSLSNRFEGGFWMNFGMGKSSLKMVISARTSRKRQIIHCKKLKMHKGYGWVRDPKKYTFNKVYHPSMFEF